MNRLGVAGVAALAGIVGAGIAGAIAAGRAWDHATARAVDRLVPHGRTSQTASAFTLDRFAQLPAPVVRYFAFALTPGQPLIRRVRIEHAGEFQARPGAWARITSVEHVAIHPPGLVRDATIRMIPLVPVRVRDSYLNGEGTVLGAAGGLVRVVDQRRTREMAEATLMRFLAEATWFPTALLPDDAGAGVVWTAIDDSTARATLTDGGVSVPVDFHFGPRGEVVRTSALRYRDVNGTPVLTPWVAHWREYAPVDGMMIPLAVEVEWRPPEGQLPCWRGRVTRAAYERAR